MLHVLLYRRLSDSVTHIGEMAAILRLAKAYPFTFGLVYSGVKTCGCDLMVQKVSGWEWRRSRRGGSPEHYVARHHTCGITEAGHLTFTCMPPR